MTIEFQAKRITFPSASGKAQSAQQKFTFSANVWSAQAALNGFSLGFSNSEHHLFRQEIDVTVASIKNREVVATVTFALRDSSGVFDDAFEGYVDVLVIADIGEINILPYIRGGGKVALRSSNGKYVSAEAGAGRKLEATKDSIGDEEKFTVEIVDNLATSLLRDRSRVALRAKDGKLVCAEGGGGKELIANRDQIGPWETFTIRKLATDLTEGSDGIIDGEIVALLTYNGQILCAEDGGGREVLANRTRVGQWETFTIVRC
jgi:hypothetical protein